MSKNVINNILFLILGIFIFYLINSKTPRIDTTLKNKIEHLQQKVDSVQTQNKELRISADSLHDSLLAYQQRVTVLNIQLDHIKTTYEKKLAAVDTLTDIELQQFFTDRYRQYTSPTVDTHSEAGN